MEIIMYEPKNDELYLVTNAVNMKWAIPNWRKGEPVSGWVAIEENNKTVYLDHPSVENLLMIANGEIVPIGEL